MAIHSVTSITLTEDDIDDFNKALSLAFVGGNYEAPHESGDSGAHLKNLCDAISQHLCRIRNRRGGDDSIMLGSQI
ncbi:hypothetical protein E2F46_10950 [Luteimonas aestuarii]|uniref:Uncharacterized protein n=1 Tax=Luteimonas aestuarii TaxID=453837 RepID=A0A4R5TS01_9GAMM|nr:hypothetical protein [Luteimonas aestuarii]TDK23429.1 hypothetical protein E2F46_10950 [Luteimonas aestuarii]